MTTEQETLERLRAHLHDGKEPLPEPGPGSGQVKVKLGDLADFLAENPSYRAPKGEPMTCAKCERPFQGGTFRVGYRTGWFCRHCYGLLALAPVGARCIYCKDKITIDCWRYKLHSILDVDGELRRFFCHQECEKAMRRLEKAA